MKVFICWLLTALSLLLQIVGAVVAAISILAAVIVVTDAVAQFNVAIVGSILGGLLVFGAGASIAHFLPPKFGRIAGILMQWRL